MTNPGSLYIVATPIGNMADITQRALQILARVKLIAAEDTRHSQLLLNYHSITNRLLSLHEFNETKRLHIIIEHLKSGDDIALISDAGTPLISDPGYLVVQAVRSAGLRVIPIPGPCALVAALSAAGLPTDHFLFNGFLSAKNSERKRQLTEVCDETPTLIFYESPHRILKLCEDIASIFPKDRKVVLAKELTKTFESFYSGTASEACDWLSADSNHQKGEFVVLVEGAKNTANRSTLEVRKVLEILLEEMSAKKATEITARITGEKKKTIYQLMLEIKKNQPADDL